MERMIASMRYAMFLYIDPATGGMLFTIIFGMISAVIYLIQSIIIKLKYSIGAGKSKDKVNDQKLPIVIFSDHKRYWNIFEPICAELENRKQKAYYYTMSEDDPALKIKYDNIICEFIGNGNKAFSRMNFLNAWIVLSTTPSLDVFQWKRAKGVDYYIHIPHMSNDISIYRMFGLDYYDAVLLSGDYQMKQIRQLESLRNLPNKDLQLVGIPYMDELKRRLENDVSNTNQSVGKSDIRTVLLAPSWGTSGILSRFGERIIDALIETGYNIILRPHPQSFTSEKEMIDNLMTKYNDESVLKWNTDNDNYNVLKESDIIISDFSGVLFDFALVFDKPVIFTDTDFDKSPYDCAWIDEELWTFKILPYIGKELNEKNMVNIKELIDDCIENPYYAAGRDKARDETWAYIGKGAENTVDYLINKYRDLTGSVESE